MIARGGCSVLAVLFAAPRRSGRCGRAVEPSFLLPPASVVAERAWEVWPTREFLLDVAASLKRLAVGFAIGAGIGIASRASPGRRRAGARRALEPLLEFLRAIPPIALVPVAIVSSVSATG